MNLQFLVKPKDGCDWHRLVQPMDIMMRMYPELNAEMLWYRDDETSEKFMQSDILLFNRFLTTPTEKLLELKKTCKLVMDIDDYWHLYYGHIIYEGWYGQGTPERIEELLSISDLVFVTNEQLKEKAEQFNKNVVVVPNAIAFHEHPLHTDRVRSDKTRFIYAGGSSHLHDLTMINGKLRRIASEKYIRDNAEFILAGYREGSPIWETMADIFRQTNTFKLLHSLELHDYMLHYRQADVALVPLVENEFNKHKSILKILEAAASGLPCIVSAVWPYLELKGAPGLLWVEKPSDWIRHIRFCMKNPDWVKVAGEELYYYMSTRYEMGDINQIRMAALQKLHNDGN